MAGEATRLTRMALENCTHEGNQQLHEDILKVMSLLRDADKLISQHVDTNPEADTWATRFDIAFAKEPA